MAYKVLYKSNPKIDQFSLWGTHDKKEDAIKHAQVSAKKNPGYQFKVVADEAVAEVTEEAATSGEVAESNVEVE